MEEQSRVQKAAKSGKYAVMALRVNPLGFVEAAADLRKVKLRPELTGESDKTLLSRLKKEMGKPRVARSARKKED